MDADASASAPAEAAPIAAGLVGGTALTGATDTAAHAAASTSDAHPQGWTIKGNADSMLYHTEESPWYGRTKAEAWFPTEEEAQAAGYTGWDHKSQG